MRNAFFSKRCQGKSPKNCAKRTISILSKTILPIFAKLIWAVHGRIYMN